jgi:hypothetical protein
VKASAVRYGEEWCGGERVSKSGAYVAAQDGDVLLTGAARSEWGDRRMLALCLGRLLAGRREADVARISGSPPEAVRGWSAMPRA